jgi:nitrogen fixation protein NifU and related proteins
VSNLEELYREVILDHYRSPRNRGELETPPAILSEGKNPLCGDELKLYVQIKGDVISDVKMGGSGCSISQASASMMTSAIKGKTISEARILIDEFKALMDVHESKLDSTDTDSGKENSEVMRSEVLGELEAMTGVVKFPVRIKCATLSFNTLARALDMNDDKVSNDQDFATTE